jgi:hypothetical protein
MIKEIPKSDIITRPIKVYKEWILDENDVFPVFAENPNNALIDVNTDEKSHGIVKKVIYESIKSQFYRNSATASLITEVGLRQSYTSTNERNLDNEFAIIPIPQIYYGEGVKVGSVRLEDEQSGKIYTDDGYSNLIDSGSNVAGNIFYDRGLIILTRDVVSGSVLSQYTLDFRSSKTIYENEILLSVLESEFNVSQNPTAVDYDADGTFGKIKLHNIQSNVNPSSFSGFGEYDYSSSLDTTGSYLAPYITTIALYDDELNMVAVAKLPQPIKSMPDYPLNFIVRFDT